VIVLALDGALGAFSTAIARDGRIAASRNEPGSVALERGLVMVEEVLRAAAVMPAQIERLAIGVGPGSFTGLRIAIAYAKSLAAAWGRPLVPIQSFDLLEFGADFDPVLTVVVGRPGIISARYRRGSEMRRASGQISDVLDALLRPPFDSWGGDASEGTLPVVGAPKDVLHALAERDIIVRSVEPIVTPAAAAAALAASLRRPPLSLHEITADYGELPAAKVPKF
jgi:tRNA threonylcarbamoyl adenosine modification protein YeaZ